jgi:hypothetical protein
MYADVYVCTCVCVYMYVCACACERVRGARAQRRAVWVGGCTDFAKLLLYLVFIYAILQTYGMPLHIIRDLYFTFRSFATRLADVVQYRRATYNMNERYESVCLHVCMCVPVRV